MAENQCPHAKSGSGHGDGDNAGDHGSIKLDLFPLFKQHLSAAEGEGQGMKNHDQVLAGNSLNQHRHPGLIKEVSDNRGNGHEQAEKAQAGNNVNGKCLAKLAIGQLLRLNDGFANTEIAHQGKDSNECHGHRHQTVIVWCQ